jgi:hypothetical protein
LNSGSVVWWWSDKCCADIPACFLYKTESTVCYMQELFITTMYINLFIQEEIKSRLKLGNACYHSVLNLLSSTLLSKNLKIKIYRTIILPVILYWYETW